MIKLKTDKEIELMRIAGKITGDTLRLLERNIRPNITTKELDKLAYDFIISQGALPSFKDYNGFPATLCVSVNEELVHGIPSSDKILKDGDIVSIDVGASYHGYNGDACRTVAVGKISPNKKRLIRVTEKSFFEGIKGLKAGAFVGDIGYRVESYVKKHGYSVVRELVGHGVGTKLHEEPDIPNYGRLGSGPRLNEGAVIAIEPMVNMGERYIEIMPDGWTVVTRDGLLCAHYENTVLIKKDGVEILTL